MSDAKQATWVITQHMTPEEADRTRREQLAHNIASAVREFGATALQTQAEYDSFVRANTNAIIVYVTGTSLVPGLAHQRVLQACSDAVKEANRGGGGGGGPLALGFRPLAGELPAMVDAYGATRGSEPRVLFVKGGREVDWLQTLARPDELAEIRTKILRPPSAWPTEMRPVTGWIPDGERDGRKEVPPKPIGFMTLEAYEASKNAAPMFPEDHAVGAEAQASAADVAGLDAAEDVQGVDEAAALAPGVTESEQLPIYLEETMPNNSAVAELEVVPGTEVIEGESGHNYDIQNDEVIVDEIPEEEVIEEEVIEEEGTQEEPIGEEAIEEVASEERNEAHDGELDSRNDVETREETVNGDAGMNVETVGASTGDTTEEHHEELPEIVTQEDEFIGGDEEEGNGTILCSIPPPTYSQHDAGVEV